MQSFEAMKSLAAVDRDLILQQCLGFFEAVRIQDLDACMSYFAPNAVFNLPGDKAANPVFGTYIGIDAIRKAFAEIIIEFHNVSQHIQDVIIDHDRVVVYRLLEIRHRGGGPAITVDFCDLLRYRDGLIIELTGISDMTKIAGLADADRTFDRLVAVIESSYPDKAVGAKP